MSERDVRRALAHAQVPDEAEARARAWELVHAAYEQREPGGARRTSRRPVIAIAAAALLAGAATTPPGQALVGSVRDAILPERIVRSQPALFGLPTAGRLLVNSSGGAWIVHRDGSKRRLGPYRNASWSPRGLHVVATRGHELVAVDPKGNVKWSLARRGTVTQSRWSTGLGYRVAYLSDENLRVVAGDGRGDRLFRPGFPPAVFTALAWRPRATHVLAAGDRLGRVHLYAVDTRKEIWVTGRGEAPFQLEWTRDGQRLFALGRRTLRVFGADGTLVGRVRLPLVAAALAVASRGHAAAVALTGAGRSRLVVVRADRPHTQRLLFAGAGRFSDVEWSPDGRWLALGWESADQWLFIRTRGAGKIVAVSDVSRQFDTSGRARFPTFGGWCCA